MSRANAAFATLLRLVRAPKTWSRQAKVASVGLLIAIAGNSVHVTAQATLACTENSPSSPQSCNVMPLDAQEPSPVPRPPGPPSLRRDVPVISFGVLPAAKVGRAYMAQLEFPPGSSGDFGVIGKLPAGLRLDRNRLVSGTPARAGNYVLDLIILGAPDRSGIVGRWRLRVIGGAPNPKPNAKPKHTPAFHRQIPQPRALVPNPTTPPQQEPVLQPTPMPPQVPYGRIDVYRLTAGDLLLLDAQTQAEASARAKQIQAEASARATIASNRANEVAAIASNLANEKAVADQNRLRAEALAQAAAARPGVDRASAKRPRPDRSKASATSKQSQAGQAALIAGVAPFQSGKLADAIPSTPSQPAPTAPRSLADALKSIRNVEYPTEALFRRAAAHLLQDAPVGLIDQITARARKQYRYANEIPQLSWQDVGGWKAVRPIPSWGYRTIYGFMPFWWGQPVASLPDAKVPPFVGRTIDFSLFDRIGIVGAQLSFNGRRSWIAGAGKFDWAAMSRFARTAQAHGTDLDLVLEASNWSALPDQARPEQIFSQADLAADQAVGLLQTELDDPARYIRMALLPIWQVDDHVFSGLTVMFTPPPSGSRKDLSFQIFMDRFMRSLIAKMKSTNRLLTINVAVSAEYLCNPLVAQPTGVNPADTCHPGVFALDNLNQWHKMASHSYMFDQRRVPRAKNAQINLTRLVGREAPPTKFNFLVFVPEPTRDMRKRLRATIDSLPNSDALQGPQKVALLRSIIPVMFGPGDWKEAGGEEVIEDADTVTNQFAYYDEVFGGVGFWPVPMTMSATGSPMNQQIHDEFFSPREPAGKTIIPDASMSPYYMSLALRLILEALVVAVIASFIYLYVWGEISDRTRTVVMRVTFGLAILATALFFWLLITDPALAALAGGNEPLGALGMIVVATIFVFVFKPKIRQP